MKSIYLFDDFKHFTLDFLSLIPDQVSKIFVHALLTVGIFQAWKLFRKHAKKFK